MTTLKNGQRSGSHRNTEEERRVFRECNQESFWYRSLPISVISMALKNLLNSSVTMFVSGALMASGRFGSLPKATCQEKFRSLENSPLGEALRQRQRHQPPEDEQKKHMLYEELRRKNRENYEVTTPKPETLLKPSAKTNPAKRGET
uniref:OCIA domain-containing protein 1 n=1 Tax=Cyprinus carpio TaxID=7962 RepID=A0A8C1YI72_CYPCA